MPVHERDKQAHVQHQVSVRHAYGHCAILTHLDQTQSGPPEGISPGQITSDTASVDLGIRGRWKSGPWILCFRLSSRNPSCCTSPRPRAFKLSQYVSSSRTRNPTLSCDRAVSRVRREAAEKAEDNAFTRFIQDRFHYAATW